MGLCASTYSPEHQQEREKNKEIQRQAEKDFEKEKEKVKLLLLGAGESGKSTIFKQMKILYGAGFTPQELEECRLHIHSNIIDGITALCQAVLTMGLREQLSSPDAYDEYMDLIGSSQEALTSRMVWLVKTIWNDPAIKLVWERRAEMQIIDSVSDFINRIDLICMESYKVTEHDMLLTRVRTTGIKEERYVIGGTTFEMYDVGGQRNERKKWIHCFEGVNAVIFVAALSEFDQTLFEDETTNRMVEAIDLFEEICNNRFFLSTSMILFLNKRDLFQEKIRIRDIASIPQFNDYEGKPRDYQDGVDYFRQKFIERACNGPSLSGSMKQTAQEGGVEANKTIYSHVTCATDTSNIEFVFNACKEIILQDNLKNSGFIENF